MELAKLRKLSPTELTKEIKRSSERLVQLQSEVAMHKIKNLRQLRSARRELARLLTVKSEQAIISEL